MSKIWFITGANRGFGREFAIAALARGDRVAATSRKLDAIADLVSEYGNAILPLALDVTDRAAVIASVSQAVSHFGRLDVVINNAGYGLFGAIEEISEQQLRDQLEVNLFGLFHVTQAVLPVLREQKSGHIIQISTIGGIGAFPSLGGYHASKWAVEGLSESLAKEVAGFGIKVTLVEPGPYSTDWAGSSAVRAEQQPQYDEMRQALAAQYGTMPPDMVGDPKAAAAVILKIVDAPNPPLRMLFGKMPAHLAPTIYAERLESWKEWQALSIEANGR
jgi:NAD(P)-dependent dehydrogenase (short-subunit alcohol dehydrogenase family)